MLKTTVMVAALFGAYAYAEPLGSAFTYHGRLTADDSPAEGTYDLRFAVYDSSHP